MSNIHVARDRQPLGQFSAEEVAAGLKNGRFLPSDLAWRDPMDAWKPLGEFTDLPEVDPVLFPPPLPPERGVDAVPLPEPSWERRAETGVAAALVQTVYQVFSAPTATFRAMRQEGGLLAPLSFYLIVASLTTWVSMFYSLAILLVNMKMVRAQLGEDATPAMVIQSQVFHMVTAPAFLAAVAFALSGLIHLILVLLGGPRGTYQTTFRVFCYAVASASVLNLVPVCGWVLLFGAGMVFVGIGLREAHRTAAAPAVIAVLVPALGIGLFFAMLFVVALKTAAAQGLLR